MTTLFETLRRKNIAWQDNFISLETCQIICEELEFAFWKPSTVVEQEKGELIDKCCKTRVSETADQCFFSEELLEELSKIESALEESLICNLKCLDSWQAIHYNVGGKFNYHYDCGYWHEDPRGEREKTVLLYLNTPELGGSTHFRELELEVEAKAGRLVAWNNLMENGDCNHQMIHAGEPILAGQKYILVAWVRQRAINI